MADVIIRDMKMPKYTTKAEFGIDADGNPLCMIYHENETEPDIYDVIPLPKGYGRLIDADALIRDKSGEATLWCGYEYQDHSVVFEEDIKNAPTIVPAERGTDDG